MNPALDRLGPYPFERLAGALNGLTPAAGVEPISLAIGEPRRTPPQVAVDALRASLPAGLGTYPATRGSDALRVAASRWLARRFDVRVDPDGELLPVLGSREGLFAVAQALVDRTKPRPLVVSPNPFYQIYAGAAAAAGASLEVINLNENNNFTIELDSISDSKWADCQLVYVCSPGNPSGTVTDAATYQDLIALADRHDFAIVADECYIELYRDEPPPSLLEVCRSIGRDDFKRCLAFHSLSKRSSLPGLRSGFVAGDRALIAAFLRYRTYHGSAMSPSVQQASIAAWDDDAHVVATRAAYNDNYAAVLPILESVWPVTVPPGAFYLWIDTGEDDKALAQTLYEHCAVTTLPGSFLSVSNHGENPGSGYLRLSLVGTADECVEAATRIRNFLASRQ